MGKLAQTWEQIPDVRVCQLIMNVVGSDDPFYLEDAEFEQLLDGWLERRFL